MAASIITPVEITHFHGFCGSGAGAMGFNQGHARYGSLEAKFRCLGGIDNNAGALRDFQRLTGVPGTLLDLFDRQAYRHFNDKEPPAGWKEATPEDILRAAGGQYPTLVFLSAPCKGFSGLLSASKSITPKYVALNSLTLRGVWLMLEAFKDKPPAFFLFENVPLLLHRGRHLVDQIMDLFRAYGYACAESVHDCGELGGLGQSRKRCLIVARHMEQVLPGLYEPPKRTLRSVGDVIGRMPLPGDSRGGPMHRIPNLAWKTWVRLAMVEAGKDWRSLERLNVKDGYLTDYVLVPEMRNGAYGVNAWDDHMDAIQGANRPANGGFSVADPRPAPSTSWNAGQNYGVLRMRDTAGAVSGQAWPNQGRFAVEDCRVPHSDFHGYRVVRWQGTAGAITAGGCSPGANAQSVADPRPGWDGRRGNNLVVGEWEQASRTIIAGGKGVQGGWISLADPRPGMSVDRAAYLSAGHYGVLPMSEYSGAVSASACHDNGYWSVADRRLPAPDDKLVARIISEDNTHHRPLTTLELAALQSFFDPDEYWSDDPKVQAEIDRYRRGQTYFKLDGESDSAWRERIGNAVPPAAAAAIASAFGLALLQAMTGETYVLSSTPWWVQPYLVALSVARGAIA